MDAREKGVQLGGPLQPGKCGRGHGAVQQAQAHLQVQLGIVRVDAVRFLICLHSGSMVHASLQRQGIRLLDRGHGLPQLRCISDVELIERHISDLLHGLGMQPGGAEQKKKERISRTKHGRWGRIFLRDACSYAIHSREVRPPRCGYLWARWHRRHKDAIMAKKTKEKKPAGKSGTRKPAKSMLTAQSLDFMERYINNASPTGFESGGQRMWLDYIAPWVDTHFTDPYGTAVGVINPSAPYKGVIEAHADEISWFVHYITSEGFIYVRRNGGSDHMIAPSKRVNIHTDKGIVKAIFGWPAIHVRTPKNDPSPSLDNIFLDCGCASKEEVE